MNFRAKITKIAMAVLVCVSLQLSLKLTLFISFLLLFQKNEMTKNVQSKGICSDEVRPRT